MASRNDRFLLSENSSRSNSSSCSKFLKSNKTGVQLLVVIIACIPIAFVLSEVLFYFCSDYLIAPKSPTVKSSELASRIPAARCGKRIINYHKSWDIDIKESKIRKLTHLIYAFAHMNPTGDVSLFPEERSSLASMRTKARQISNDLKVMIAIGGARKSQHFSSILQDSSKRNHFIESIAAFLVIHKLDGVDIFWVFPVGKDSDNIITFLKELRAKLTDLSKSENKGEDYIISFGLSHDIPKLESFTCLEEMLKYIDFINVISYDYFGPAWWPETGPSAPLYSGPKGKDFGNVDSSMRYLACRLKRPSQLNMGLQFCARYWKNVKGPIDESDEMWRIAEKVNGKIDGGTITWEISEKKINKTAATWHNASKSSYIWDPKQEIFISFESERGLLEKRKYARDNNFGGVFIWAVGSDDDEEDTLLNLISGFEFCTDKDKDFVNYDC